jgi:hypothetical protein
MSAIIAYPCFLSLRVTGDRGGEVSRLTLNRPDLQKRGQGHELQLPYHPDQPTPEEISIIRLAWEDLAA